MGIWVRFDVPTNLLELSRVTTPLNSWCLGQKRKSIAPSNLDGWQCICKLPLHTGFADCHHVEKTLAFERLRLTALVRLCTWSFDTADRDLTRGILEQLLPFSNHLFLVWCDSPFFEGYIGRLRPSDLVYIPKVPNEIDRQEKIHTIPMPWIPPSNTLPCTPFLAGPSNQPGQLHLIVHSRLWFWEDVDYPMCANHAMNTKS